MNNSYNIILNDSGSHEMFKRERKPTRYKFSRYDYVAVSLQYKVEE